MSVPSVETLRTHSQNIYHSALNALYTQFVILDIRYQIWYAESVSMSVLPINVHLLIATSVRRKLNTCNGMQAAVYLRAV